MSDRPHLINITPNHQITKSPIHHLRRLPLLAPPIRNPRGMPAPSTRMWPAVCGARGAVQEYPVGGTAAFDEAAVLPDRAGRVDGRTDGGFAEESVLSAGQVHCTTTGTSIAGGALRVRLERTTPSIMTMPTPGRSPSWMLSSRVRPAVCWATCQTTHPANRTSASAESLNDRRSSTSRPPSES